MVNMIKSLLFLSTVFSVVNSRDLEKCYDKFCYSWDGTIKSFKDATKCKFPYWDLEIYDKDIAWEVRQFVTFIKLQDNQIVPLGMTCNEEYCKWKKLNIKAEYNKIHRNYFSSPIISKSDHAAFFSVPDHNNWHFQNITNNLVVIICMRENKVKTDSTKNEKSQGEIPKGPDMLIIGVVLGLASLALLMLMVALLVVVFKRKRSKLKSSTTRSRSFENYRPTRPLNSPSSLPSSDYADIVPISESSPTYANPVNPPSCSTESTNILYADLDWSQEHDSKPSENVEPQPQPQPSESKADKITDFYENHASFKLIGPMGDEYALVSNK